MGNPALHNIVRWAAHTPQFDSSIQLLNLILWQIWDRVMVVLSDLGFQLLLDLSIPGLIRVRWLGFEDRATWDALVLILHLDLNRLFTSSSGISIWLSVLQGPPLRHGSWFACIIDFVAELILGLRINRLHFTLRLNYRSRKFPLNKRESSARLSLILRLMTCDITYHRSASSMLHVFILWAFIASINCFLKFYR